MGYIESDEKGDWYGIWVYDLDESIEDFLGSIRFPLVEQNESGIGRYSTTWIEIYYKDIRETPIPSWHVSIDGMYATESKIGQRILWSVYSAINHTDVYYDRNRRNIHMVMGPEIAREHPVGELCNGSCFLPFD